MEVQKHLDLLLIAFLVFQLGQTTSVAGEDFIRRCCRSSKYPDLCYSSLSHFAGQVGQDAGKLASVSTSFCLSKVQPLKAYISSLKTTDPKLGQSLKQCMENFGEALDNIQKSEKRLKDAKSGIVISDVKTWMSAALTNLDTCIEGLKNVPDGPVKKDLVNRTSEVEKFNSIALALINVYAQT